MSHSFAHFSRSSIKTNMYARQHKRGCVLIINNSFKDCKPGAQISPRSPSCYEDLRMMEHLWKDCIGCDLLGGKSHQDCSAEEMHRLLLDLSQVQGYKYGYVVAVIMTHGQSVERRSRDLGVGFTEIVDAVLGNDVKPLLKMDIESMFRNDNAARLQGIPKFFIYQSCRGLDYNYAVKEMLPDDDVVVSAIPYVPDCWEHSRIPVAVDIISVHPSQPGYVTYMPKDETGSWFISTIYKVFMEYSKTMHVADMLTLVNSKMFQEVGNIAIGGFQTPVKSMSMYESSLRFKFYLIPQIECGDLSSYSMTSKYDF